MTDFVVACRSGHTYAQKPSTIHWNGEKYAIKTVNAEWRSPDGKHFQVTTENGHFFELIYNHAKDNWQILQP